MLDGVLFDLDDTLYDYAPCNESALQTVFDRFGHDLSLGSAEFRELHDQVRRELAEELHGQAPAHNRLLFFKRMVERQTGRSAVPLATEMFELYWNTFLENMRPAADAHAVLRELCASMPLALVSNHTTDIQLRKVARLGFESYFQVIVTSEEVGAEKPSAVPFLAALTALKIEPAQALMVGDDPGADIRGAAALGIHTVLTSEFARGAIDSSEAERVVTALAELPGVVAAFS